MYWLVASLGRLILFGYIFFVLRFRLQISGILKPTTSEAKKSRCTAENPFVGETHAAPAAPAVTHKHCPPLPRSACDQNAHVDHLLRPCLHPVMSLGLTVVRKSRTNIKAAMSAPTGTRSTYDVLGEPVDRDRAWLCDSSGDRRKRSRNPSPHVRDPRKPPRNTRHAERARENSK